MKNAVYGVFAMGELPPHLLPGGYVLNSDVRSGGGEHWLALYVDEDGTVEFMDSLGHPPEKYGLRVNATHSIRPVQANSSTLCGLYVLYYLFWRTRGVPMDVILDTLPSKDNDAIVLRHRALTGLPF